MVGSPFCSELHCERVSYVVRGGALGVPIYGRFLALVPVSGDLCTGVAGGVD